MIHSWSMIIEYHWLGRKSQPDRIRAGLLLSSLKDSLAVRNRISVIKLAQQASRSHDVVLSRFETKISPETWPLYGQKGGTEELSSIPLTNFAQLQWHNHPFQPGSPSHYHCSPRNRKQMKTTSKVAINGWIWLDGAKSLRFFFDAKNTSSFHIRFINQVAIERQIEFNWRVSWAVFSVRNGNGWQRMATASKRCHCAVGNARLQQGLHLFFGNFKLIPGSCCMMACLFRRSIISKNLKKNYSKFI